MEESEQKVSKYNSGIAIIMRLDALWKDTHRHSRLGQFQLWNSDLDRIWCELARDLSDKDYKESKTSFDDFDERLKKYGQFQDKEPEGFIKLPKEVKDNRGNQYKILMEKELFLRRLENHLGKGTAWDEGDEDDFE